MRLCSCKNCNYYVFKNSDLCSLHYKAKNNNLTLITQKDILLIYNVKISGELINKNQEKNLINLIEKLPKDNISKLIKIVKVYLKTINKRYISASLALKIFTKFNNFIPNIHYIYNLVGDYWNIGSGHNSVAICYYYPESVNGDKNIFYSTDEIPKIRSPLKYKETR